MIFIPLNVNAFCGDLMVYNPVFCSEVLKGQHFIDIKWLAHPHRWNEKRDHKS